MDAADGNSRRARRRSVRPRRLAGARPGRTSRGGGLRAARAIARARTASRRCSGDRGGEAAVAVQGRHQREHRRRRAGEAVSRWRRRRCVGAHRACALRRIERRPGSCRPERDAPCREEGLPRERGAALSGARARSFGRVADRARTRRRSAARPPCCRARRRARSGRRDPRRTRARSGARDWSAHHRRQQPQPRDARGRSNHVHTARSANSWRGHRGSRERDHVAQGSRGREQPQAPTRFSWARRCQARQTLARRSESSLACRRDAMSVRIKFCGLTRARRRRERCTTRRRLPRSRVRRRSAHARRQACGGDSARGRPRAPRRGGHGGLLRHLSERRARRWCLGRTASLRTAASA